MSERESDKKQICKLCKEALELNDENFNMWFKEINRSNDPVIINLCSFLKNKRGAL